MRGRAAAPELALPTALAASTAIAIVAAEYALLAARDAAAAKDERLRFVASAEDLLAALEQSVPHIVITKHLDLTEQIGTGPTLAVRGTRSIMVWPCPMYLLLLLQALSFCWLLYLLQEVGLNLDQLVELEQHVPHVAITQHLDHTGRPGRGAL
jgi:hypothetical protein